MGRLSDLRTGLIQSYDTDELIALCLDLEVTYEHLHGDTLPARVTSLLKQLDVKGEIPKLVAQVAKDRPTRTWVVPPPRSTLQPNFTRLEDPLALTPGLLLASTAAVLLVSAIIFFAVVRGSQDAQQRDKEIAAQLSTSQVAPTAGPQKMRGIFNIAVAPFSQRDASGQQITSTEGLELSDWIYQQLKKELKPEDALIWSETTPASEKGVSLNMITGTTSLERQDSARRLAERIGAQMIIFGELTGNGRDGRFEPEFYIDTAASKLKGEADEVIGGHKLGTPMVVQRPMNADAALNMNSDLNARAIFVRGLLFDLIGLHVEAYQNFESIEQKWNSSEADGPGKEVLPFFMARELVFLLDDAAELKRLNLNREAAFTRDTALARAEVLAQQSLSYNEDYSLAHLQLGNIYLARAEPIVAQISESNLLTSTEYAQAKVDVAGSETEYQAALDLAGKEPQTYPLLRIKAQISLANARRLKGVTQWLDQSLSDAQSSFDAANQLLDQITAADVADKPRLWVTAEWIRGSIALGQAGVHFQMGDDAAFNTWVKTAQDTFTACVQQPDNADRTLKRIKGQCQQQLDQLKEGTK